MDSKEFFEGNLEWRVGLERNIMKASHVDKLIGQIYDEINNLKINFPYSNQEFTYCFRGEAKDYGNTKLTPTLFREKLLGDKLPDKELINLITDYKIADSEQLQSLSKAIEGQHFLALSRLLDITFSILPAIFFAASSKKEEDGYVYIFRFPKTYSPSSSYIVEYYEQLIGDKIFPYYHNFKVLSHTQSNNRIKSQSGGFILFPGTKMKNISENYYGKVVVKSDEKSGILEELDNYFNINESTIYPEKDKKSDLIKKRLYLISNDTIKVEEGNKFYKSEVMEALERIKFEIVGLLNSGRQKKEILRILRREERDLLSYISCSRNKFNMENHEEDLRYESELKQYVKTEMNKWKLGI